MLESQMRYMQISVIALASIYLVLGANVFGVGIYVAYVLKTMPEHDGALLKKPWILGTFSLATTILALIEIGLFLTIILVANETSGISRNASLTNAYKWLATLDNMKNEVELSKRIQSYAIPLGICVNFVAALQIFSGVLACAVIFGI
ncbi:hypothetical protein ECG_03755 [Echinococcus granulosus]|uniref:Multicopper oxidase copper binding site n=1 Tax=Echinococcus granulosus TaxID=6210 RepID=A0A068WK41_ECHGR|nr:hypothetical protein ECG_03755 [Echinococcus granulosus]CDS17983.1 Multicopper oxidase copper binding site [Echinococcus granulosus]